MDSAAMTTVVTSALETDIMNGEPTPRADWAALVDADTNSLIDGLVKIATKMSPRIEPYLGRYLMTKDGQVISGDQIEGPAAVFSYMGLSIALIDKSGGYQLLLHPDTYCEIAEISREELDERIASGKIPTIEMDGGDE